MYRMSFAICTHNSRRTARGSSLFHPNSNLGPRPTVVCIEARGIDRSLVNPESLLPHCDFPYAEKDRPALPH